MDIKQLFQSAGLAPMRTLTLTITANCNLRCDHCWPECGGDAELPGIASTILLRVIRQFGQWGLPEICLTGGEPLTHSDWMPLVRACCEQDGFQRVRLQTNATLLSDDVAMVLSAPEFRKLIIEVSLDGADAVTHDRVRGAGNYELTMHGLRSLTKVGLGPRTVVAFTEMAHNFHQLPELLAQVKSLGVSRLISGTLVQSGRASRSLAAMPPTPSQYEDLLDRFQMDAEFRADYRKVGNIACLEWLAGRSSSVSEPCRCAEMPYIAADGTLYPCTLLPLETYGIPGAFSRPLEDVVKQAAVEWNELSQWYERRRTELAMCRECRGYAHCGGGCLGRACSNGNGFMQVEDRCALRKAVYAAKF